MYARGVDRKVATRAPGSAWQQFLLQDHIGTRTAAVQPNSSSPAYAARPDAFGNGGDDFTGREYSSFTGLYYYRARMYDPQLGRFTAEDPIGFRGGDVNLYGYVSNQPIMFTDPFGKNAASAAADPNAWRFGLTAGAAAGG